MLHILTKLVAPALVAAVTVLLYPMVAVFWQPDTQDLELRSPKPKPMPNADAKSLSCQGTVVEVTNDSMTINSLGSLLGPVLVEGHDNVDKSNWVMIRPAGIKRYRVTPDLAAGIFPPSAVNSERFLLEDVRVGDKVFVFGRGDVIDRFIILERPGGVRPLPRGERPDRIERIYAPTAVEPHPTAEERAEWRAFRYGYPLPGRVPPPTSGPPIPPSKD